MKQTNKQTNKTKKICSFPLEQPELPYFSSSALGHVSHFLSWGGTLPFSNLTRQSLFLQDICITMRFRTTHSGQVSPVWIHSLIFVVPWLASHCIFLILESSSRPWFRCHPGEGLLSSPLSPLSSVCSPTCLSCWVVRTIPSALRFPSSNRSLAKEREEHPSQSVVSVPS